MDTTLNMLAGAFLVAGCILFVGNAIYHLATRDNGPPDEGDDYDAC